MNKTTLLLVLVAVLALFAVPVAAADNPECQDGAVLNETSGECEELTTDQTPMTTPDTSEGDSDDSAAQDGSSTGETNETAQNGNETVQTKKAELIVRQPHYVDSGVRVQDRATRTYIASGEVIRVDLQNVNQSDVLNYGLDVESGRLVYDKQSGEYVLDTQGASGTYGVYWTVTTESGQETYRANVKVEQADYAHVSTSSYDRLKERAEFGEFTLDLFGDYCDDIEGCGDLLENQVYPWYLFVQNPLTALTGDLLAIGTLLIFRPGGWVIIGAVFLPAAIIVYVARREYRVLKRQLAEIGDLDEAQKKQYVKEMKKMISMKTWQDYDFSDTHSQFLREHLGDNPWTGFETLRTTLSETYIARKILRAHSMLGYRLVDGELVEDADEGIDPVDLDDDELMTVDWKQVDGKIVQHPDLDREALFANSLPIAPEPTDGDLIDDLGIDVGEDGAPYALVESRDEVARIFSEFLTAIASDPDYTDDLGRPRAEMDVLNLIWLFVDQSATKYGLPIWLARELLVATRDELDAGDRLVSKVREMSGGKR